MAKLRRLLESGRGRVAALVILGCSGSTGAALAQEELPEELLMGPEGRRDAYEDDGRIWSVGWQAFLARDQMTGEQPVNYGWGLGFAIPVNVDLYRGLGSRMKLAVTYSGDAPMDDAVVPIVYTIPGTAPGEADIVVDKQLPGFLGLLQFNTGISYSHGLLEGSVNPYLGFGPAFMMMMCFPDLAESDAILLENPDADDDGISSIDPYTVNLAVGANAFFGINFALARTLHLNVEAEYTQAKIVETRLEKAKEGYDAHRPEFQYGALTVSTGLVWHF